MSRIKFLSYLISEGVRSGARDIKGFKPKKDFTIGFEFEIATPELRNNNNSHDDDWENFSETWYSNGDGPSQQDYWQTLEDRDIYEILRVYNLKPRYGFGKKDDYNDAQGFFDFYGPTKEDSEDKQKAAAGIVLNLHGEEVNIFEIDDPEEFFDLFKPNRYDQWVEDYFYEYEQEAMQDAYEEHLRNVSDNNHENSIEHIKYVMEKALKKEIYVDSNDYRSWTLVADSSIDPDGGELRSPILQYNDAINSLRTVFNAIKSDSELDTNESTGLHINVGTFTKEELSRLDILKFVLLIGEDHVLSMFDREHNRYTEPHIEHILKYLNQDGNIEDISDYSDAIETINRQIIKQSSKYRFANVGKLKDGYIEIRAPGGDNYHKKFNEVVETINRVMKFLEIAMDPNAYRKEYLTKLYKLFGDKMKGLDQMSKDRDVATNQSVISNIEKDFAGVLGRKYTSIGNSIIDVIQVLVEVAVNIDKKQLQPEIMLKHSIQIRNYVNQLKKSNNNYKSMIPNAKTYINSQRDNMDKKIYTFIMGLLN